MATADEALARARAALRRSCEQSGRTSGTGVNCFEISELREALGHLVTAVEELSGDAHAAWAMADRARVAASSPRRDL